MKIAVAGTGYVGLSIATLLSQHHEVMAVDIIPEKVEKLNKRISPIQDEYIEKYLTEKNLCLTATLNAELAYRDADFVVIAAPTNYDSKKNFFDTSVISKQNLLLKFCADPKSRDEMQAYINVSSRSHFSKYYLKPLLSSGKLEMMFPDKPKSKNQKYTTVHSK